MTAERTPSTRPRLWLALGAVLAVVGIGLLWPLQTVGQVCIMIYPAPPGCGADEPRWVPLVAIGLVVAVFAAQVVLYFTLARPRVPLIVLSGAIVAVVLLGAGIVALSQTGIGNPYPPLVIID